jgi:hypothetical protein
VDAPQQDNGQVKGAVSPTVSGGLITFRVTHQNGTVTTHSTTTGSSSTWIIKIPVISSDFLGIVSVQAFWDGAGKYGTDDATCSFPVN